MILITGGLGFIGSHTTRALIDLGESCVATVHRTDRRPAFLAEEFGERLYAERLDMTDQSAFLKLGERYDITGIVHLAAVWGTAFDRIEEVRANITGLLNVLRAAAEWRVPRVGVASTIGVYAGVRDSVFREDLPLSLTSTHPIPDVKKSAELLAGSVADEAGFEVVNLRIGAIWGPLGRPDSSFIAVPRLVHGAVRGAASDRPAYAGDGTDLCYVRDCGRAIALLQTAGTLDHRAYNIGSGRVTTNAEVAAAIRAAVPDAAAEVLPGRTPGAPAEDQYLDITRLRADTGFAPAYGIERAVADYVAWLQAGHER